MDSLAYRAILGNIAAQSDPPPMPPLPTPDSSVPHAPELPSLPSLPSFEVIATVVIAGVLVFGWLWMHPRQLLRIASWPVRLATWMWTTVGALAADQGGRRVRKTRRRTRNWLARTLPAVVAPVPAIARAEERTYLRIRPAADTYEPKTVVDALRKIHASPAGGLFGSADRFEFLIAGAGEPDQPIEFYLGGPRDQLGQLAAYDPETFDIDEIAFHPAAALGTPLSDDPGTAANPTDALLDALDAAGLEPVTYRVGTWAYRWKDWMMRLVGLTDVLETDHADETPVHPLNDVIDRIGTLNEQGVPAVYQVTFTPFRGWQRQAKTRKQRLRSHADTLKERIETFELSSASGEQDDTTEAAYQAKMYERHRAEPTLDIGGVAGQRFEQLNEKETENTLLANVRIAAIPTADVSRESVVEQLRGIEPAMRGFERDFYHFQPLPDRWVERLSGLLHVRGARHRIRLRRLCERQLVTPMFGHRPWNLRRRWPDVICNPDELAALATVPCTAHLRLDASTGPYMESRPAHTRALRELTPTQRAKYLDARGLWLGHLLDADGSAVDDVGLSLPVDEQFVHVIEAGASGTGKTTNAIKRALSAFATTTGPTILVTGLGGALAENYMRAHAALFGVDSLHTHVHHFDFPEGMPGFTFHDLRQMESPYREFADREDTVQHQVSRYLAILHHLMPEEKLAEAPNSVTVLENLVRAGFDDEYWHENMPLREDKDYFTQWQLQALRARFYQSHPETRDTADPPQLSNWSYNQNLHEQLTAPGETFAAVMTGVRNRMDQLIRDNRYQQIMNNTEPRFSFTDLFGPDRDPDLLPDDRGVFIFDLSSIQEERQKGMALLLLSELFTSLKTYKEWLAGATVETAEVAKPAADGGTDKSRSSDQPQSGDQPHPSSQPPPRGDGATTVAADESTTGPAAEMPRLSEADSEAAVSGEMDGSAAGKELGPPANWATNVVVDEAAVVAGIDLVSKLLREARNLRVSMHLLMQYPKQLEEQIGEEAYNEMLNNVQTRILGPHNLDDKVAVQALPREMDTLEFARQIGDLPRSRRVVQLPPQDDDERPQPFTIHRGPLPPGHLAAPVDADTDESLPYTEAEIRDAINTVTARTQEQYGLPPDLAVGPPATVPETLQTTIKTLGHADVAEVLALMAAHVQEEDGTRDGNQWVAESRVIQRFSVWAERSEGIIDTDDGSDEIEDDDGTTAVTDGGRPDETSADADTLPSREDLVSIVKRTPYLECEPAAVLDEVDSDVGLYVRLTPEGEQIVEELEATGGTGAAGGEAHDDLLGATKRILITAGFEVAILEQDLVERPDAVAVHPALPFEIAVEVENSSAGHATKVLTNLRKAQEAQAFPLFVEAANIDEIKQAPDGVTSRVARYLTDPVRQRDETEVLFYNYGKKRITFNGGARGDGQTAVVPATNRNLEWAWTGDEYVLRDTSGTEYAWVASVNDASLGAFPAYYTYDERTGTYTVHKDGDTLPPIETRDEFRAEWTPVPKPFIPSGELPIPDYGPESYAIMLADPSTADPQSTAVIYNPEAEEVLSLNEFVDALKTGERALATVSDHDASSHPSELVDTSAETHTDQSAPSEAQDSASSVTIDADSANRIEPASPDTAETDLTPKQRSVREFTTLLQAHTEMIESLDDESLSPDDVNDALRSVEVFAVYRLIQTHREQPSYTRPSQFTGQLADVRSFVSKRIRDPADPETRVTYWVGINWAPEMKTVVSKLLDTLDDVVDSMSALDPEQALEDDRVRTYVDLLNEEISSQ